MPGTTLLRIARLLFNEHLLSVVVEPTIADLQREVADAGSDGRKRLRARWRGCCAFWTLTLVAPFASWASPVSAAGAVAFPGALARVAVSSMAIALLAVIGPVAGARGSHDMMSDADTAHVPVAGDRRRPRIPSAPWCRYASIGSGRAGWECCG